MITALKMDSIVTMFIMTDFPNKNSRSISILRHNNWYEGLSLEIVLHARRKVERKGHADQKVQVQYTIQSAAQLWAPYATGLEQVICFPIHFYPLL